MAVCSSLTRWRWMHVLDHYAQSTVSASNRFNTIHAGDMKLSKSVADPANVPHKSQQKSRTSSSSPTTPEASISVHNSKSRSAEANELHHPRISNLSAGRAPKPVETSKPAKTSKPSDESQQRQNLNGPTPTAAQTLKPTEPTKKAVESRQKPRTGSVCYTAPNGTRFPRHNDLLKWSIGVKNQHNDLVIFLPVFVESPWKGLKPILTTCASRYW